MKTQTICKVPNCNNETNGEMFCLKHENQNYHICENCNKVINHSTYSNKINGLVCDDCIITC